MKKNNPTNSLKNNNPAPIMPRPTTWSLHKLSKMTGLSRRRLKKMVEEETLRPIPRICKTISFDPETALTCIIASSPSFSYLCGTLNQIKAGSSSKPA